MQVAPGKTRIGWIGTGVMGASMCGHLLKAGFLLRPYSLVRREKAQGLLDHGCHLGRLPPGPWPNNPMSSSPSSGILAMCERGSSGPKRAPSPVRKRARSGRYDHQPALVGGGDLGSRSGRGVHSIDAPVSGGDIGVAKAGLSIMIGGDASTSLRPCIPLASDGQDDRPSRPAGSGQHTKMVNQTLIASNMIGVCEALLYG